MNASHDDLDPARRGVMRSLLVEHARADAAAAPRRARRRRRLRAAAGFSLVGALAAVVVAIAVIGLPFDGPAPVATTAPPAPQPTRTPAPTPTPTPTPTATPTPPPAPAAYTCDTLVDPEIIADLVANGVVPDPAWPNETDRYGTFHQGFAELGGVSCRWGKPDSDNVHIYSYAPVSPEQAAALQEELVAMDYRSEARTNGTVFIAPYLPGDFYLFTDRSVYETNGVESFDRMVPYRLEFPDPEPPADPPADADPTVVVNGFGAAAVYQACRDEVEPLSGFDPQPEARPFDVSAVTAGPNVYTKESIPEDEWSSVVTIAVEYPLDQPEIPQIAVLCTAYGPPDAPTVVFNRTLD